MRQWTFRFHKMQAISWPAKEMSRSPTIGRGGPRGSGRLRPQIFLMFRHYKGGRSSAKRTGRLHPRRNPWYSLSETESTSGHMVLSGVPRKKSPVTTPGIDPGTSRLVAQCLNHYATPGPQRNISSSKRIWSMWFGWLVSYVKSVTLTYKMYSHYTHINPKFKYIWQWFSWQDHIFHQWYKTTKNM